MARWRECTTRKEKYTEGEVDLKGWDDTADISYCNIMIHCASRYVIMHH